jgi:hypothetical protein
MRPGGFAAVAAVVASCGGTAPPTSTTQQVLPVAGVSDCVDPAPATTVAVFAGADGGRAQICRDDGVECRAVDAATGAMTAAFPARRTADGDAPFARVEADGQILACWGGGAASCLRRPPTAYEKWLTAQLAADGNVAVLSAEGDHKWVTTMDRKLTTVARFEVAPAATAVTWEGGRFLVHATDGDAVRGYLYDAGGAARGVVGALGTGAAFDLGTVGPAVLAPGRWAFVARDASAVAVHEVDRGDGVRIDLGVGAQPAGAAAIGALGDRTAAVALGGEAYGDVVIVDAAAGMVKRWTAVRCQP